MDANQNLSHVRSDKFIERVECLRSDLRQVKERWDNRLILENCSLSENYLNGRFEIVLYGDRGERTKDVQLSIRIPANYTILHDIVKPKFGVNISNLCDRDGRDEPFMFVFIIQFNNGVKTFVSIPARVYICLNEVCKFGEVLVYRLISAGDFKAFPFSRGREMAAIDILDSHGCVNPILKRFPKVVNSIPDDSGKIFRDRHIRTISEIKLIRLDEQRMGYSLTDGYFVEVFGERGRCRNDVINVAVGPSDL